MYFLNEDHAYNFQNMLLQDKTHPGDSERQALFYIIGSNEDLFLKRKHLYNFKDHEINPEVFTNGEVDLCSSRRALVRLGYNLYNGYEDELTSPYDLFRILDEKNFMVAKGAIDIKFSCGPIENYMGDIKEE